MNTASVKAENDTDCLSIMNQVNTALKPNGLTFEYDEDKYWEEICACAWQLKPTQVLLDKIDILAQEAADKVKKDTSTIDEVAKFLSVSSMVYKYRDRIVEFGVFPMNRSYPNGTMMACQSVELQMQMQPVLSEEEINDFSAHGFRVGKSEIIDDATVAIRELG